MQERDVGRCAACGGRFTATHMWLQTYPLDERGGWQRSAVDVAEDCEDIVVACAACGEQPDGHVARCRDRFRFTPTGGP